MRQTYSIVTVGLAAVAGFLLAVVLLDATRSVSAQTTQQTTDLQPVSHTTLGVTNTTVATLTQVSNLLVVNGSPIRRCAIGPVETGSIRFWEDGTSPDTSHGHLLPIGAAYELKNYAAASTWRVIATGVGGASIPVSCAR